MKATNQTHLFKRSTMRYTIVILCIIALLGACRKDPLTQHAEGYVRDFGTNATVAGIPVIIGNIAFRDTCISDENGFYSFDYEPIQDFIGFGMAETEKHYHYSSSRSFWGSLSTDINYDIILHPKAWIKFHVKNVNPVNEMDRIHYWDTYDELYGMNMDTTIVILTEGNKEQTLRWQVSKEGASTVYRDTFHMPAYDTIFYEILY